MWTIADTLNLALPYVQPELVTYDHRRKLLETAALFPGSLTHCVDIECRLGQQSSSTDLPFCVTHYERNVLAGLDGLPEAGSLLLKHPAWRRLQSFAARWVDPTGELYDNALTLWIEFDLDQDEPPLYEPHLFVGSKNIPALGSHAIEPGRWVYQTALPMLAGEPLPPKSVETIKRSISCLPRGAHLFQIGLFKRREVPHVRVCLAGIPPAGIVPYLCRIGYPEDLSEFEQIIAGLAPLCEIYLNIDVIEGIGPKLGLELAQNRDQFSGLPAKDAHLLDFFVSSGLCDVEKQAALLAFPGFMDSRAFQGTWPDMDSAPSERAKPGTVSVIRREVSHLKIIYQPDRPLEGKAYLQIINDWLPPVMAAAQSLSYQSREKTTKQILQDLRGRQAPIPYTTRIISR